MNPRPLQRLPSLRSVVTLAMLLLTVPVATRAANGHSVDNPGRGTSRGPGGGSTSRGKGNVIAILPDGTLRDLCTSFTQATESPFTIADGKLEAGLDVVAASRAVLDTMTARGIDAGGISATRGLPHRWDAGVSLDTWSGLGLVTGPVSGETNPGGFGGGACKLRHTFAGVDSEGAAAGIVFAVRIPGAASGPRSTSWEASCALPVSVCLPADITLGAMVQASSVADAEAAGHHLREVASAKLERDLFPHVGSWLEAVGSWNHEPRHPWLGSLDGGVSLALFGHVDASAGVAVGESNGTHDSGVFGGIGLHL